MVYNYHIGELEHIGIYQRSGIKAEQYWERPPEPEDYDIKERQENRKKQRDPDYYDSELQSYRAQEWKRRLYGFWFMNNGVPTYLTGLNYFYLAHWQIDIGYPDFRIPDMEFFYFLQYAIDDPNSLGIVEATKRRQGKCLGINELVRKYDGSLVKSIDVKEGDILMGDDSTPRIVEGVTSGESKMYKIIPHKGDSFTCNESHILHCIEKATHKEINISVKDLIEKGDSYQKRMMMRRSGFELPSQNLPVEPYFLGAWLGDGSSKSIEFYNEDQEVIDYLKRFSEKNNLVYHNYGQKNLRHSLGQKTRVKIKGWYKGEHYEFESKRAFMRHFGFAERSPLVQRGKPSNSVFIEGDWEIEKITNKVRDEFNALNLINNKHIPEIYMRSSIEQRLELLAGLIDTDGCLPKDKTNFQIAQTLKRKGLISQIKELASSCGFLVTYREDEKYNAGIIRICGDIWKIPTKIKRKQAPKTNRKYNPLLTGFKVEYIGIDKYAGFTVDKNHLFLLADGTVTHNSARSGVFLYEGISRMNRAWGGIQSKTLEDAKQNVFSGFVVSPFKHLKSFFKPIYDTDQGATPKKELRFYKPNKRGKADDVYSNQKELESTIDFKSAELFAYDGKKLQRYVGDEVGKIKDINVYERHQVVQYCLQLDNKIIGKALYTTTVEEMGNGGEGFKQLWDASDPEDLDENGRTRSGLYRYFLPAYKTLFYDDYGFPNEEKAKEFYLNTRAALQDDPRALASEIRKNPFTIEEAFRVDGDVCLYDAIKLQNQLDSVSWVDESELLVRGNFLWEKGNRDSSVIFVENKKGKFLLHKDIDYKSGYNIVESRGSKKIPKNTTKFVAGADPYDHNTTVDGRGSDGAGIVLHKYDANSSLSETFVCMYLYRPQTAEVFYEDMIKMCHFFGCKVLPEDNKVGMIKYFQMRGYDSFLQYLPKSKKAGISANQKTHQQLAEETELYIHDNSEKVLFKRLLEDWLKFDLKKTTKFDAAMAAGWCLVAAGAKKFQATDNKKKLYSVKEIFG